MEQFLFPPEKRAVLENLHQPFAVYRLIGRELIPVVLSDGFLKLFGYESREEAVSDTDSRRENIHPDDASRMAGAVLQFASGEGSADVIYRAKRKDGPGYLIIHAVGEQTVSDEGIRLAEVWFANEGIYDENSAKDREGLSGLLNNALHEQNLLNASRYDYLTGLPNMTSFFELAETIKTDIQNNGGRASLLYIDFSGMKFFNTKYGFAEGDRMLQKFAGILADSFSAQNCCRIGSDHFAAITEETGLEEKLNAIFRAFGELYDGKTPPVHVGIFPYASENVTVSTACDRAKYACGMLRGTFHSCFSYFSAELRDDTELRQYILENFDTAMREKWIRIYLQPIIRIVNGRVCDVEALARWNDPEKGLLPPSAFIPTLEETGLIYKLDLFMVDQVIESIQVQNREDFDVIPHSINLSRSDFDACDIVEEIRRRVDDAGIRRDRITIEITESVIGSDFEFMKSQIDRFRTLGFPVWMDDFGSGYSSLDVLQNIRFDLIKFDMSFMRRLDESDEAKVILTELMRMATGLGVDTVCEGVETESQVRFLKQIGCSKLQGYYFSKPLPFETILEMHRNKILIDNENPRESEYYESIGRVNLFDLGVIGGDRQNPRQNAFESLPISVLEVRGEEMRYIRTNPSFQDFILRFFKSGIPSGNIRFDEVPEGYHSAFLSVMHQCCSSGNRIFFDEKMPDGSTVHCLARRISVNPVTGFTAVAIAVLSVSEPDESTTYADIARSLAADYYNIFVIDLNTNDYIEYTSRVGEEELSIERHGEDFFDSSRSAAMNRIYEEDRETFLKWFTRENVLHELDTQGVFTATYRLIDTGVPMYVNMKITRMQGGNRLILGVSIIDAQMKQQEEEKKLRQEKIALGRIAALSANYIVLYTIDPDTGHYTQYNPSSEFEKIDLAQQGEDFFRDVVLDAPKAIHPADMQRHLSVLTRDNMLREIHKKGLFTHNYRLLLEEGVVPVSLRAALVQEDDCEKIILGVSKIDPEEAEKNALFEAYEAERDNGVIYTRIAQSLARGYTDLYYVNIETNELIEFHTDDTLGLLSEARRSDDFFEGCQRDAKFFIHPEDQELFLHAMKRDFLLQALKDSPIYELTYRRLQGNQWGYVKMRVSRIEEDRRFIVLAVSDIDELIQKRKAEERIQEERIIYARLHALTGNFIVVYVVDPKTGRYREFSSTADYSESMAQAKEGADFFHTVRKAALAFNHPDDLSRFLTAFTKENILAEVERSGIFTLGYRIMMEGRWMYVQMKAAMAEEKEGLRLIVGLNNIDAQVRQEMEQERRLMRAESIANVDALTGVRNKHAYLEAEAMIDRMIADQRQEPFAIVMMDVNDLKKINDFSGHQAGDEYLRNACKIICGIFKHSPVFRVGGDEFAVIVQGEDYDSIEEKLQEMREHNQKAKQSGGIVIACGMAKYECDSLAAAVFERADHDMYEDKNRLKSDSGH